MFPKVGKNSKWILVASIMAWFSGLSWAGPAPSDGNPESRELWYRVEIAQAPAGWMMMRETKEEERWVTESSLHLQMQRAGTTQSIEIQSRFVETPDHRPMEAWVSQRLGQAPIETSYVFEGNSVRIVGATGERRVDSPAGPWLTPFAANAAVAGHLQAALDGGTGEAFEIRTLDPTLGLQPLTTRWQLVERDVSLTVAGRQWTASRWRQSPSYAPTIVTTSDVTRTGDMLRSTVPIMGMEMAVTLSTKEAVLSHGSEPAPELLVPSFVYPDRRIERPRQARRAIYRLRLGGEMPELPQTGAQRSEPTEDGARVWVSLDEAVEAAAEAPDPKLYLGSTEFLRHDDPVIRGLVARIPVDKADAPSRAEAMRRFVGRHLKDKNLDSILATASEAAADGTGDCTEHAVLLAAMLRADGIPSRVAVGVIYAEQFAGERDLFAYHMWTQAWLQGRWLDLDATLDDVSFDAAHITMGTSALSDEGSMLMDLANAGPLIGEVAIEIEHVGYETSPR